jgi:hypothetical protein
VGGIVGAVLLLLVVLILVVRTRRERMTVATGFIAVKNPMFLPESSKDKYGYLDQDGEELDDGMFAPPAVGEEVSASYAAAARAAWPSTGYLQVGANLNDDDDMPLEFGFAEEPAGDELCGNAGEVHKPSDMYTLAEGKPETIWRDGDQGMYTLAAGEQGGELYSFTAKGADASGSKPNVLAAKVKVASGSELYALAAKGGETSGSELYSFAEKDRRETAWHSEPVGELYALAAAGGSAKGSWQGNGGASGECRQRRFRRAAALAAGLWVEQLFRLGERRARWRCDGEQTVLVRRRRMTTLHFDSSTF